MKCTQLLVIKRYFPPRLPNSSSVGSLLGVVVGARGDVWCVAVGSGFRGRGVCLGGMGEGGAWVWSVLVWYVWVCASGGVCMLGRGSCGGGERGRGGGVVGGSAGWWRGRRHARHVMHVITHAELSCTALLS